MRIEIPQIFWHGNRDRIMSIDFYPNSNIIVTCGAEEDKMWIKVLKVIITQLWEIEEHGASAESLDIGFKTGKANPFMNGITSEKNENNNVNMFQSIIHDENPFNNHQNINRISYHTSRKSLDPPDNIHTSCQDTSILNYSIPFLFRFKAQVLVVIDLAFMS